MCVFKRICSTWNLELDIFDFLKKDIPLVKNCGCRLRMKIADRNCRWSAFWPLDAGNKCLYESCSGTFFIGVKQVFAYRDGIETVPPWYRT